MKTKLYTTLVLGSFIYAALAVAGDGPCKPKAEAKHSARKALHECIETWGKDRSPSDADPSDDCSAKLSAFVQAAKDVKACRVEHQKKK